ncbi:MAG: AAA family ATPase [Candidatus Heimdallarchaeaceae archaeon]
MKRIVIMGNAASGKSTLSIKIRELTGIPVYHLDKILWKKNWERTAEEEFIDKHNEIINKAEWILEGVAYKSTYEDRFEAADTIVYLDTPVEICKERAVRRAHEDLERPNTFVNEGCPYPVELIDKQHEVIDLYNNEYRVLILEMINKYKEKKKVVHLVTEEDVYIFLESL